MRVKTRDTHFTESETNMKVPAGLTFSIAAENKPAPGCTISNNIHSGINEITIFSMAKNTDISAETYLANKFIMVHAGSVEIYEPWHKAVFPLCEGASYITPAGTPFGVRSTDGAIYTEITFEKGSKMNEAIKAGEVFTLAEKLPYQEGKIVNMDVVHNDKMKFALMAFDAGEGLSEHAASGEALIFALEGEGEIGYEGKTHTICAGENFHFAKGGKHWVSAKTKFKMALLLTLE